MARPKKATKTEPLDLPAGWKRGGDYANGDITASGPGADGQIVEVRAKNEAALAKRVKEATE